MADAPRYAIGNLADLGGVSRRTVRYYVQEGLLQAPLGVGRGSHYGRQHLERLLQVKALQEAGRTLDEIRRAIDGTRHEDPLVRPLAASPEPVARAVWRRLTLAPGVELHVSSDVRLPSPGRLRELSDWCRVHLAGVEPESEESHE